MRTTASAAVACDETANMLRSSPFVAQCKKRFVELAASAVGRDDAAAGDSDTIVASFAPGRINLIGEHVDYMGGAVLPAAIDRGVLAVGALYLAPPLAAATSTWTFFCGDGAERATFAAKKVKADERDGGGEAAARRDRDLALLPCCYWDLTLTSSSPPSSSLRWIEYVRALAAQVRVRCDDDDGDDKSAQHLVVAVFSTLPIGAGLSSSAAFIIAVMNLLLAATDPSSPATIVRSLTLPPPPTRSDDDDGDEAYSARRDIALAAQATEHRCGTNCGIMDQLASLFGSPRACLLTDCARLHVEAVPLRGLARSGVRLVLVDSVRSHQLGNEYNELRAALERGERAAAKAMATTNSPAGGGGEAGGHFSVVAWARRELDQLRDTNDSQALTNAYSLADAIGAKIAAIALGGGSDAQDAAKLSYMAAETARTVLFCQILRALDDDNDGGARPAANVAALVAELGRLLNGTHDGLSNVLRVSTPELDFIQRFLVADSPASLSFLGARMMGGGFGGCVLALVQLASSDDDTTAAAQGDAAMAEYMDTTFAPAFTAQFFGFQPRWYPVAIGAGASII